MKNKLLWKPTLERVKETSMFKFIEHINLTYEKKLIIFINFTLGQLKIGQVFGMLCGIFIMLSETRGRDLILN